MLLFENTLGTEIGLLPIAIGKPVQPDGAATGWRMHETPLTYVDRRMAHLATSTGREEQQIARLKRVARNTDAERAHGARGTWQRHAGRAAIDIADQSAAIETAVRRIAAVTVRRAHQPQRREQHLFRGGGWLMGSRRGNDRSGRPTGAGRQQHAQENDRKTSRKGHDRAIQGSVGVSSRAALLREMAPD